MEKLNATVQEAKALYKTAVKYAPARDGEGIPVTLAQTLSDAIDKASAADVSQQNASRESERATAAQDDAMERAFALVRKLRSAAKACLGDRDKQAMKDFHVGKVIQSVKEMVSELSYLATTAARYAADLAGFGVKDVAALDKLAAELSAADAVQENARNARKAATAERDKALANLELAVRRVRNAAKSLFGDNKSILIAFNAVPSAARKIKKPKSPGSSAKS